MTTDSRLAIVGLGYVGLPLAIAFAEAGHEVVGVDASAGRIAELTAGRSPIDDISDERLAAALADGLSVVMPDAAELERCDAIFVCVPTPITKSKDPDLAPVISAAQLIAAHLRKGQLVVLQSTTFPGTTTGPFRAEPAIHWLDASAPDQALAGALEQAQTLTRRAGIVSG